MRPKEGATAVVEGLAGWVPPRTVPNDALPSAWEVDDAWVRRRTGIAERHWADPGTSTGDLALRAAVRALDAAGNPRIDAVVLATSTPDRPMPAMAPELAARLGLGPVAAWDVSAACSGFVYALATATGVLACGIAERVLLVATEVYSTLIAPDDRSAGVVFADGAGAVILGRGERGESGSVLGFDLGSDGTGHGLIEVAGGGALERSEPERFGPGDRHFRMDGREVFQHAVLRMTASSRAVLDNVGWRTEDVDHFVGHQANARILGAVGDRLGVPAERRISNIARVGNTGAASIPLALADAAARDELRPGARVLLTSFGAGLTWGSAALVWPDLAGVARVSGV
ncbi:beta-ketoacyl-ACP synthase 3 [Streptomyces sp. NBC_00237]|uniref:beta-ketoacyl-ACP synthase 3 n=1 Tax=Streptomyces sp. NBC_00237 TaxID=2975687 RepID=UPI00225ABDA4|nr:beta-ketoacyl-ACP synthase 3 [Streptomyces sp. NBC_00237]MCX5205234.1 beta-ketoacyl-ACP synthase 3 [Streptomyces sp. NBC_00237]